MVSTYRQKLRDEELKSQKELEKRKQQLMQTLKVKGTLVFQHNVVPMLDWWRINAKEQQLPETLINDVTTTCLRKKTHQEVYDYLRRYTCEV